MKIIIKQPWIDANTARPENGEKVVIHCAGGYICMVPYWNGFNCIEDYSESEMTDVTHWMRVAPPKERKK